MRIMTALRRGLALGLGVAANAMVRGVIPIVVAALPAATSVNGKNLSGTINTLTGIAIPSGDWSIGGWFRTPAAAAANSAGTIFHCVSATSISGLYSRATGLFYLAGSDDASVPIGAHSNFTTTTKQAVVSQIAVPAATDVYVVFQKVGTKAQIWLTFPGHAPLLAAEEETLFGAKTNCNWAFARTYTSTSPVDAYYRRWHKLSYSLTRAQILQAANDVDPTTFGTPAATDFFFPMTEASTSVLASTINGLSVTHGSGTNATTAGIGTAAISDGVFLDPVQGQDGFVFQHQNGLASVTLSGMYRGTDGDIQVQLIDDQLNGIQGWTTVKAGATGGTWTATAPISIAKGKRWIRVQLRKLVAGVPGTVNTSTIRFGIGENVMLDGQSLMDYHRNTGNPYGWGGVTITPYASIHNGLTITDGTTQSERITISGAASNGGLIEITCSNAHGRRTGDRVTIGGIVGTTEANNSQWIITVTSTTKFTLNGSTFVNAYTSGGTVYTGKYQWLIPNQTYNSVSGSHATIVNYIANNCNCVVCLCNRAVGGTSISNHLSWVQTTAPYTILAAQSMLRLGWFVWQQGNNDIGLSPISQYFSDGGVSGAWTGYGLVGQLKSFYEAQFPNSDFMFGMVPFTSVTTQSGYAASIHQSFRWGMDDWSRRKFAAGDTKVFWMGWQHDFQPQLESNGIGAHHPGGLQKGQRGASARLAQDLAYRMGGVANDSFGPMMTAAVRSGANIDITVVHNGGTTLRVPVNGAVPTGFEVSTTTNFASKLTISTITLTDATHFRITLAADPGQTVYVRYMYGKVGDYTNAQQQTVLVTGLADNGAGLIRVSTGGTTVPSGRNRTGGHGLVTGNWVYVSGCAGTGTAANGWWQVTVVDSTTFDLVGSSSATLGAFTTTNLWGSGGSPVVETELAVPIYDDRTIGGYDTYGAPLQPTFTYLQAA